MALFRRKKPADKKTTQQVTPEVADYYKAERRERTWVSWLLGLATLLATILLVLGLFLGGRWIYRELTNKNDETQTTNQAASTSAPTSAPSSDTSGSGSSNKSSSSSSDQQSSSNQSSTSTSSNNNTDNSAGTGDNSGSMPDTGPGNLLSVFLLSSLVAYSGHRLFTRKLSAKV